MCCITEVKNTQVHYAEDIDIVMPMYNLIEYSNADSKSLWQYYRDEPTIIVIVLIFLLITIIVIHLNFNNR